MSGVTRPITHIASAKMPDRNGVENDEKKIAIAATVSTSNHASTIARTTAAETPTPWTRASPTIATREQRDEHGQHERHAEVLADDELPALDRLADDRVDRAALDLGVEQEHAEEDRGQRAEQRDAGEPDVARDARLLADRHLAEHDREQVRADDEHDDAVEHADARRLAKRVERDRPDPSSALIRGPSVAADD